MDPRQTQYQGQGRATQYNTPLPPYPQPNQAGATNLCWPPPYCAGGGGTGERSANSGAANNRQTQYAQYQQDQTWPGPDYGGPQPEHMDRARQQNQPASDGNPCWNIPGCHGLSRNQPGNQRAANDTDPAAYPTNLDVRPRPPPPINIPGPRPPRHTWP